MRWKRIRALLSIHVIITTSMITKGGRRILVRGCTKSEPFHRRIYTALKNQTHACYFKINKYVKLLEMVVRSLKIFTILHRAFCLDMLFPRRNPFSRLQPCVSRISKLTSFAETSDAQTVEILF